MGKETKGVRASRNVHPTPQPFWRPARSDGSDGGSMAPNEGFSMIPRDRAALGEAEAVSGPAGGRHAPAHPKGDAGSLRNRLPVWEDLYRAISPEQQRELLSLAERQGVLYAHQLPV